MTTDDDLRAAHERARVSDAYLEGLLEVFRVATLPNTLGRGALLVADFEKLVEHWGLPWPPLPPLPGE
jgi:hypothetical protein